MLPDIDYNLYDPKRYSEQTSSTVAPDNYVVIAWHGLLALALLVCYFQFRHFIWRFVANEQQLSVTFVCLLAASLAGFSVKYPALPGYFRRLLRIICAAVLGFLLLDPVDLTLVDPAHLMLAKLTAAGYVIAVLCAIVSLKIPSFILFPSFYLYISHAVSERIVTYGSHRLASVTLFEMAQYLGFCLLCLLAFRIPLRHIRKINAPMIISYMFFIAIGLHFSHYFWSGLQKLRIGESAWSWAMLNQTQNMMLSSLHRGVLPSASFPAVTQWLYDSGSQFIQPLNIYSLLAQLLAVIAVFRIAWIRLMSIVYDSLHVGIYIFSGLFLWPWVANNIAILIALKDTRSLYTGWPVKLCFVITIAFGGFNHFGNSSRLAWWDLRDITTTSVQARIENGPWVNVPVSFFNSHAQTATMNVGYAQLDAHYRPSHWGSDNQYDVQRANGHCPSPGNNEPYETFSERQARITKASGFLLSHHEKLLSRELRFGSPHPYPSLRYQHSTSSMPVEINSMQAITEYRVLVESTCLSMLDGELKQRVLAEDSFVVPVNSIQ